MIIGPLEVVLLESIRVPVLKQYLLARRVLYRQVIDEPLVVIAVRLRVLRNAEALPENLLKQVAADAQH